MEQSWSRTGVQRVVLFAFVAAKNSRAPASGCIAELHTLSVPTPRGPRSFREVVDVDVQELFEVQ